jgi:large subunit ribosomal protein L24
MLYEAPTHIRHKLLAAHLSPQLRTTHLVKSLAVRNGDTVRVMRGDHKGFEGKITRIDLKAYRIYMEGLTREKVDGTTIFVPVHPSKVMVTRLNLDDKWRKKILERKQKAQTRLKEAAKKPELEVVEKPPEVVEKPPEVVEKPPEVVEKPPEVAEVKEPFEEKVAAVEKPQKKKAGKGRKKATKAIAKKKGVEAGQTERERKPRAKGKSGKRKATKKIEEGEV